MKTKTIIPILLVIAALTLTSFALIPKQAHSLQGSFLYVSLGYGRGWWPWTCVVEQGLKAEDMGWALTRWSLKRNPYRGGQQACFTEIPCCSDMRDCPFEYISLSGYSCNKPAINRPVGAGGLITSALIEITIPSNIKLVTSDGYVVKDEICADDTFTFEKGIDKGEWWFNGGVQDSPPIYWVDDVEQFVLDLMEYHENTITDKEYMLGSNLTYPLPDDHKDNLTGISVYGSITSIGENVSAYYYDARIPKMINDSPSQVGNVICSIKEKNFDVSGAKVADMEYVPYQSEMYLNAEFVVECTYYYYGIASAGWGMSSDLKLFRFPTVIQAGPDAVYLDFCNHNIKYDSIEDFFRVGIINFTKNIKVVEPVEEPELRIKTIITDNHLDHGETTYAHLLITNKGAIAITLKDIESNVNHEFIYCDKETLQPNEQADCVLILTPDIEVDITATVNFEYRRCGKRIESSKRQASSTIMVQPLERCTKSTDCKAGKVCCNRVCRTALKGACDDFDGDGYFEWMYY